jgi:hypothetical protein
VSQEIRLTRGQVALVDDEDYARLNGRRWHAHRQRDGKYCAWASVTRNGPKLIMSRVILGATSGEVDHVNGDTLDNRKGNLRPATHKQNLWNQARHRDNRSGFKGVTFCNRAPALRKPWQASLCVDGRSLFLGRFASATEAAQAYDAAARQHHGEFARLNFPTKRARA